MSEHSPESVVPSELVSSCRSYSPRRVRARRGEAYEQDTVPGSPQSRSSAHKNGQRHQHKLDSAVSSTAASQATSLCSSTLYCSYSHNTTQVSLDVADPTVSPRRAAAVRDEVTEDEWGSTHRSDPLGIVKAGRYGVCVFTKAS